jgi:hypothetical protein
VCVCVRENHTKTRGEYLDCLSSYVYIALKKECMQISIPITRVVSVMSKRGHVSQYLAREVGYSVFGKCAAYVSHHPGVLRKNKTSRVAIIVCIGSPIRSKTNEFNGF